MSIIIVMIITKGPCYGSPDWKPTEATADNNAGWGELMQYATCMRTECPPTRAALLPPHHFREATASQPPAYRDRMGWFGWTGQESDITWCQDFTIHCKHPISRCRTRLPWSRVIAICSWKGHTGREDMTDGQARFRKAQASVLQG